MVLMDSQNIRVVKVSDRLLGGQVVKRFKAKCASSDVAQTKSLVNRMVNALSVQLVYSDEDR